MQNIRVRYAPSPTGIPHIGNIRTALFNYLIAQGQNGKFILRIEDTDQARLVPQSLEKIKESLKALGLIWDEEEQQSKRLEIYSKHLDLLKEKGAVYEKEGAWYFKIPKGRKIKWQDIVHGDVEFSSDVVEDFVIIKSDKFPTYHFASVVDDHEMKISHVLRGDEWISSTPKHLLLYEAFSWTPPKFVHLPPILGQDKKKLSKRQGAKSVLEYTHEGYLPEAIVNFLALLGWSPKGDEEIFSLEDLTKQFSLDRINKNSPVFNLEKLTWFNQKWIKKLPDKEIAQKISLIFKNYDPRKILELIPLVKDRIKTLLDFKEIADFFFVAPAPSQIPQISLSVEEVKKIVLRLDEVSLWNAQNIKLAIEESAKIDNVDRIEVISAIRNIVSGKTVTPPLYESLEKLSKKETLNRLNDYIKTNQ